MIDQKKVQNMTRLAIFEKHHTDEIHTIKTSYRSDYVSSHLMKNWFRITLAFGIGFALWALYRLDEIADSLNRMEPVQFGLQILTAYLIAAVTYLAVTWAIYTVRYRKMKKVRDEYQQMMERLIKEYQKTEQRRTRE